MRLTDAIKRIRTDAIPIQCSHYAAWLSLDRALGRALDEAKFIEERLGIAAHVRIAESHANAPALRKHRSDKRKKRGGRNPGSGHVG